MKKISSLLIITIFLACCDKDDNKKSSNPVDQLPPATQTGANTFGCLLDGQVFKPGLTSNSYNCFYQLVDGEYYFAVNASNQKAGILKDISIATNKRRIFESEILDLIDKTDGNASGSFYTSNSNTGTDDLMYTSKIHTGKLKITKLDFTKNVVSGTFWYDIKDSQGVVHQIREGRFDMQFTQ